MMSSIEFCSSKWASTALPHYAYLSDPGNAMSEKENAHALRFHLDAAAHPSW